jgi:hypothetical protein
VTYLPRSLTTNKLIIGLADKTAELTPKKPGFLLIDDGPFEQVQTSPSPSARPHSFNPLPTTYRTARKFADALARRGRIP